MSTWLDKLKARAAAAHKDAVQQMANYQSKASAIVTSPPPQKPTTTTTPFSPTPHTHSAQQQSSTTTPPGKVSSSSLDSKSVAAAPAPPSSSAPAPGPGPAPAPKRNLHFPPPALRSWIVEKKGWPKQMPDLADTIWTAEHKLAWKFVGEGKNIVVHGPAGTGKSVWLRAVCKECRNLGEVTYVTATTGTAAYNLNVQAITLHAWYGAKETLSPHYLIKHMHPEQKARLCSTDVLIVDECSMLSGSFFEVMDTVLCSIRNVHNRAFGGIQLILLGDVMQLPPVCDKKRNGAGSSDGPESVDRLIENKRFTAAIDELVGFTKVLRQKDPDFVELLQSARVGDLSDTHMQILQRRVFNRVRFEKFLAEEKKKGNLTVPTFLHPNNKVVHDWNEEKMSELEGESVSFETHWCVYSAVEYRQESDGSNKRIPSRYRPEKTTSQDLRCLLVRSNIPIENSTELKVGAQVMLVRNIDTVNGLTNGSTGVIVHIGEVPEGSDLPNWRKTVLPDIVSNMDRMFPEVSAEETVWVQFRDIPVPLPIGRYQWKGATEISDLKVPEKYWSKYAVASQIPLILAWALSIHKAQGKTLPSAYIYLGPSIRTHGQAYTALSRVVSMDGLFISELKKSAFIVDKEFRRFANFVDHVQETRHKHLLEQFADSKKRTLTLEEHKDTDQTPPKKQKL